MDVIQVSPAGIDTKILPAGGGVYLMRSGRYVKIGQTKQLAGRLRGVSTTNPDLTLIGFFRHDRHVELERHLHHKFRDYRYRGEWFELVDAQVYDVERLVRCVTPGELDACAVRSERPPMSDPTDLGDGRWKTRVYLGIDPSTGKQIRKSKTFTAGGIRAARSMAHLVEAELRAEHAAKAVDNANPTLRAAAENWWLLWSQRQRSPTTRKGYRSILDGHILSASLADERVTTVSTGQVERWYASLDLSPSTVRRIHAVLTQILDQCVRDEVIERNPATLAYKPESRPKQKTHTPIATVMAILEAAHRRGEVRSRALAFAALTGLRRGEMCGLRWSALDLDAGICIVELNVVIAQERHINPRSSSHKPVLHVKDPKAHQVAAIALGSQAADIAAEQMRRQASVGVCDDPFLWSVQAPYDEPLHPDTMTNWATQAVKDAGVKGVSLHDLRHWQGSQMLEVGGTIQEVKERLRHKSLATTMGYLHADQSKQRVLVDLLPRLELPAGSAP